MVFDPLSAKKDLDCAYKGFEKVGDLNGLFLSCSAVMDAYLFAEDDMTPVISWGERLESLRNKHRGFPTTEIEARVLGSTQGLMYAAPHHPLIEALDESVDTFIDSYQETLPRIAIAYNSLVLALWRGNFRRAVRIIDEINPQLTEAEIPPLQQVMWRFMEGNYAWATASHERAHKKFEDALSITQAFGMPLLSAMLYGMNVYSSLSDGNVKQAELYLAKAEATNNFQRRHALGQFSFLRAGIALMKGNISAALDHGATALSKIEPLGRPFLLANCRLGMARVLIECGNMETARSLARKAIDYARTMKSQMLEMQALLVESYSFLKEGKRTPASALMSKGLQIGNANEYLNLDDWWRPHIMSSIFAHALEEKIETKYVQNVIRRRKVAAPSPDVEEWPWRIKVYTLGKFEVLIDDQPLRFSGKSQRKPLELLQCLCAHEGIAVPQDRVTDALWPDSDGDASGQAFRTTLHRLRRLLQCDEAIRIDDRQLSLNPSCVWVDCFAFERIAKQGVSDPKSVKRAVQLYGGHFLQGQMASWILVTRERLRAQYMMSVEQLGTNLEKTGDLLKAIQCYLNAFEIEPVAEIFCRRIMASYVRLERRSEALAVYQRFSQSLRDSLGVRPSDKTIALYNKIKANEKVSE